MKRTSMRKAFTVPELLVVCAFAALLLVLFFVQKSNVDAMNRDEKRKTAINAMYYALEESFYENNKYCFRFCPLPLSQPMNYIIKLHMIFK